MEEVIDKVKAELEELVRDDDGGIVGVVDIKDVYFGDPGNLPVQFYPCIYVEPETTEDDGETTGYHKDAHTLHIEVVLNAPEYYTPNSTETPGTRELVKVCTAIKLWFMRYSNRRLEFMPGVRYLTVPIIDYERPPMRGVTRVKSAQVTLVVHKQYSRQS